MKIFFMFSNDDVRNQKDVDIKPLKITSNKQNKKPSSSDNSSSSSLSLNLGKSTYDNDSARETEKDNQINEDTKKVSNNNAEYAKEEKC